MPCHWILRDTKETCPRSTKNEYCGTHAFAIKKRGARPPIPCLQCGNGTNSYTKLCVHCGQHIIRSRVYQEKQLSAATVN